MNKYASEEILTLNITTRSRRTFELKDRCVENRRTCEPTVRRHPVASAAFSGDTRMRELNCTQKTRNNHCALITMHFYLYTTRHLNMLTFYTYLYMYGLPHIPAYAIMKELASHPQANNSQRRRCNIGTEIETHQTSTTIS